MNAKQLLEQCGELEFMRKLSSANEVTLTECLNSVKRNKAVMNFHLNNYFFQQKKLFNEIELAAAIIDMKANLEMMLNKLNELK